MLLSYMLTTKQQESLQNLKDGKLNTKQKADFYYRLSNILKTELENLDDLLLLLDEIPDSYEKKIDFRKAAVSAMKLTEKLIEKVDPLPVVYPGGKAVKNFLIKNQSYIPGHEGPKTMLTIRYTPPKDEMLFFDQFSTHIRALEKTATPKKPFDEYKVLDPEDASQAVKNEMALRGIKEYTEETRPAPGTPEDLLVLNSLLQAQKMGMHPPSETIKELKRKLGIQEPE